MALKTKPVTVTREGRDKGKKYMIIEMPAEQAWKWAFRAFGAMARSGIDIPQHVVDMGLAGIAAMGIKAIAGIEFKEAEPLLDEITACIRRIEELIPEGRALVETDIEEPLTYGILQSEVFELHTGFSVAAYLSKEWAAAGEAAREKALQNT